MAQSLSTERNNRNNKENLGSRTCRCAASASNKIHGQQSSAKSTTSTATNTNTVELLQNPNALPIREFEKLSPIVSATLANSARSSLSSVHSSTVDAINSEKTTATATATTTTTTTMTSTTTASNIKSAAVRNQIDKLLKNETTASGKIVETIYLNVLNKKNLKKMLQSNGNGASLTESKSSISEKESCSSGSSTKRLTTDDALILRICDLEYATRHPSTSHISATTQNGRSTSAYSKVKIKVRTKTDPHPVSSSQKQRRSSSTTTSTIDLKNYQKCSSQNAAVQHNGSKCNCSSCNISKVSSVSSENRTKSVGTQHNAAAQCAFDPWVKQSTAVTENKRSQATKSGDSIANAIAINPLLNQKLANTNAKVIVITEDFKKKALNQEVLVDTKRKILRYMKANGMLCSSRSMDDVRIATTTTTTTNSTGIDCNQVNVAANMNEHQMNTSVLSINKSTDGVSKKDDATVASAIAVDMKKTKAISKSVDNISVLSAEMDALGDVGSVELIFISDEFLNKVSDQDVIILENNPKVPAALVARKLACGKSCNGNFSSDSTSKNVARKQIVVITDEFCRKSIEDKKIVIVDEPYKIDVANNKPTKHRSLNRQSSAESSVDDVNNKITSRAFQSYDEEAEHLESKEIQENLDKNNKV